jgi:hypothetical protein
MKITLKSYSAKDGHISGIPGQVGGSMPAGVVSGNISIGGSGSPQKPSKKDVSDLVSSINRNYGASWGGTEFVGNPPSHDPDAGLIAHQGKAFLVPNKPIQMLGKDEECHWNVSRLYREGKIDSIVIGYTRTPIDAGGSGKWFQHTWGLKNGEVVETTKFNTFNKNYFGVALNKEQADAFATHVLSNTPGDNKVRYV